MSTSKPGGREGAARPQPISPLACRGPRRKCRRDHGLRALRRRARWGRHCIGVITDRRAGGAQRGSAGNAGERGVRRELDEAVATPGAPAEPDRSRVARAGRNCCQEPPLTGGAVLEKHLCVGVLVEADDHGLSRAKAGSPEVAGRADHGVDCVGRSLARRLPLVELLALGDDQPGCGLGQGGCVLAAELAAGGDRLARLDSIGVQELGRSSARGSALPLVVPVDLLRHRRSSRVRS